MSNQNWKSINQKYISNIDSRSTCGKLLIKSSINKSSVEFFEGFVTDYLEQRPLVAFVGNFCLWEFWWKQRYLGHFFQKNILDTNMYLMLFLTLMYKSERRFWEEKILNKEKKHRLNLLLSTFKDLIAMCHIRVLLCWAAVSKLESWDSIEDVETLFGLKSRLLYLFEKGKTLYSLLLNWTFRPPMHWRRNTEIPPKKEGVLRNRSSLLRLQ